MIKFPETILHAEEQFNSLGRDCLAHSKDLFEHVLPNLFFNPDWLIELDAPVFYRCFNKSFDVLSVAGALADGARFTIGGSQGGSHATQFGNLGKKRAALYASESWQTAILEAYGSVAEPNVVLKRVKRSTAIGIAEISLKSRKRLKIIDFEKAEKAIEQIFPAIIRHMAITSGMNGKWPDLKRPAPCQLLGHWLSDNSKKADGIRYQSTVDPMGHNVCLFLKDDAASRRLLKAKEFQLP